MAKETAISNLIRMRLQELRITRNQLVVRCGYRNVPKGLRRLDAACSGDFACAGYLLDNLANALSVETGSVQAAVEATKAAKRHEEDRLYRALFRPHAIIQTDRARPEPLFVAMTIGFEQTLRIDFHQGANPITFAGQAIAVIKRRLGGREGFPAFGRPTGFVVNYSHDTAVSFDLDGTPQRTLDRAKTLGKTSLFLRNSKWPE